MSSLLVPALFAAFAWWATTGVILWLDHRSPRTFGATFAGATALLAIGMYGLAATAGAATVAGGYLAFVSALLVWAWIEVAFLLGYVVGPRRTACPPYAEGWRRFRLAVGAILWHELAILALGAGVWLATWNGTNRVGVWTFVALWAMRTSAKLNLFLGVRNLGEDLLPDHLRYLQGYFRRRSMNALFPFSVTLGSAAAGWFGWQAFAAEPGSAAAVAYALLGTLLLLAMLEHWFMVLPTSGDALWQWAVGSHRADEAPPRAGSLLSGAAVVPGRNARARNGR